MGWGGVERDGVEGERGRLMAAGDAAPREEGVICPAPCPQ